MLYESLVCLLIAFILGCLVDIWSIHPFGHTHFYLQFSFLFCMKFSRYMLQSFGLRMETGDSDSRHLPVTQIFSRLRCFYIQRFHSESVFFLKKIWQPPALPCRHQHSTIGRLGLNHRVRDGNGCFPQAHRHQNSRVSIWSYGPAGPDPEVLLPDLHLSAHVFLDDSTVK